MNHTDDAARPPITRFEWAKRKQVAIALARRLPDLVTPIGTLVIEGYGESADWLLPDELLPVLDSFAAGQVHLFSTSDQLPLNRDLDFLVKKGIVVLHVDSLASVLLKASQEGALSLGPTAEEERSTRRVRLGKSSHVVPHELWNKATRSAVILDESATTAPRPISDDARYREFRTFLGGIEGKPNWAAFARGFAFIRDFERDLLNEVVSRLGKHSLASEPVIVHGQTGTGKTVALASIAFGVAHAGQYPVLYVERRSQKPVYSDIDRFCQWAEDAGAPSSLVIWDGMTQPVDYSEFLRRLTSRGRKIVLVGSSYQLEAETARSLGAICAPAELSAKEQGRFKDFLSAFDPSLVSAVMRRESLADKTFLVALYRILPPTRGSIRAGVASEAGYAEEQLAKRAAETEMVPRTMTVLEQQLRKAGLISTEPLFSELTTVIGGDAVTDIQRLTGLVMVPGRFGLRVPLELLLRTLGKRDTLRVVKVFKGIDIFRWSEDSVGNIEIGPRNALEAQLIVHSRMGGPQYEIDYARALLLELKDSSAGGGESREITFGVDLLRALGPQGDNSTYFRPYFRDLAQILKELRTSRGVSNPRLMLQEVNLLREWAMAEDKIKPENAEIDIALADAESVVKEAIEILGAHSRNRALKNSLFNELTAGLAARARRHTSDPAEAKRFFEEAQVALRQARRQDPDSYYPVDILAWFTKDMIRASVLDEIAQAELVADALAAFQTAESMELAIEQRILLQSRRMELGSLIQWRDLEEDAFRALEASGSTAGYYLRALRMSGLPKSADNLTAVNDEKIRGALDFLREHHSKIVHDARCLDLMFDLWWTANAGARVFSGERVALPFQSAQWHECLTLLEDIERTGDSQRPLSVSYFRGLALFHLDMLEGAAHTFKELDKESERSMGRRRIVRSYVASTPQGLPRKFHGTVAWAASDSNRGAVHVEELRRPIDFRPRDFGKAEIEPRSSLGEFHIAFNFVGPIADPVTLFKR